LGGLAALAPAAAQQLDGYQLQIVRGYNVKGKVRFAVVYDKSPVQVRWDFDQTAPQFDYNSHLPPKWEWKKVWTDLGAVFQRPMLQGGWTMENVYPLTVSGYEQGELAFRAGIWGEFQINPLSWIILCE
jgi:hypothetical protein